MNHPCVNCGYCCRKAHCGWGDRISEKDPGCRHLIPYPERPGRWLCGIYDKIVGKPTSEVAPAFGAGCCASINTFRRAIIEAGPFIVYKRWKDMPGTAQPATQEEYSTREKAEAKIVELRGDFPGREFAVVSKALISR